MQKNKKYGHKCPKARLARKRKTKRAFPNSRDSRKQEEIEISQKEASGSDEGPENQNAEQRSVSDTPCFPLLEIAPATAGPQPVSLKKNVG